MTDTKPKITPPPHLMLTWQEEARDEVCDVANHFDRQSIQMIKAANWGWQQRDASVGNELQEARDEELEACIAWMVKMGYWSDDGKAIPALRAARRPKPKSQVEEALEALERTVTVLMPVTGRKKVERLGIIRAALERLRELEGNQ